MTWTFRTHWLLRLLALSSCCLAPPIASGDTISLSLQDGNIDRPIIAVNVGDTVTWTLTSGQSGWVQAIGGAWQSPVLTNVGSMFSHTFTNVGFVAYRAPNEVATIDVLPWIGNAPAVTITDPIDGLHVPSFTEYPPPAGYPTNLPGNVPVLYPIHVSVSVSASSGVRVECYASGVLVGVATNAPYAVIWTNPPPGQYVLMAKLIASQGDSSYSRPVGIVVGVGGLYRARRLPDGEFLCYYSWPDWATPVSPNWQHWIVFADSLPAAKPTNIAPYPPDGYGIWIDPTAVGVAQRFYQEAWEGVAPTGGAP